MDNMDIEALGLPDRHIIFHVLRMLGAEGLMRCLQKSVSIVSHVVHEILPYLTYEPKQDRQVKSY